MNGDETRRLWRLLERMEDRQQEIARESMVICERIDTRLDSLATQTSEERREIRATIERLREQVTKRTDETNNRLDELEDSIVALGVKTGAELGKAEAAMSQRTAIDEALTAFEERYFSRRMTRRQTIVLAVGTFISFGLLVTALVGSLVALHVL